MSQLTTEYNEYTEPNPLGPRAEAACRAGCGVIECGGGFERGGEGAMAGAGKEVGFGPGILSGVLIRPIGAGMRRVTEAAHGGRLLVIPTSHDDDSFASHASGSSGFCCACGG